MSDSIPNNVPLDPEAIAALAYRLWQQRGCPAGSGEEDWLHAEALLRAAAPRDADAQPTMLDTAQSPTQVATQVATQAGTLAEAPCVARPRTRRAPRTPAAAGAAPRKTRVRRTRPARPDA